MILMTRLKYFLPRLLFLDSNQKILVLKVSTNLTVTATDSDSSDNDADITFALVDHSEC